jgi:hypothetical protein
MSIATFIAVFVISLIIFVMLAYKYKWAKITLNGGWNEKDWFDLDNTREIEKPKE